MAGRGLPSLYGIGERFHPDTRKGYSDYCRVAVRKFRETFGNNFICQFKLDGTKKRVGVVVAFVMEGALHVGASKCNKALRDKFNSDIGVYQAIRNSVPVPSSYPDNVEELHVGPGSIQSDFNTYFPLSMHVLVCRMIFRGRKYLLNAKPPVDDVIDEAVASGKPVENL